MVGMLRVSDEARQQGWSSETGEIAVCDFAQAPVSVHPLPSLTADEVAAAVNCDDEGFGKWLNTVPAGEQL